MSDALTHQKVLERARQDVLEMLQDAGYLDDEPGALRKLSDAVAAWHVEEMDKLDRYYKPIVERANNIVQVFYHGEWANEPVTETPGA